MNKFSRFVPLLEKYEERLKSQEIEILKLKVDVGETVKNSVFEYKMEQIFEKFEGKEKNECINEVKENKTIGFGTGRSQRSEFSLKGFVKDREFEILTREVREIKAENAIRSLTNYGDEISELKTLIGKYPLLIIHIKTNLNILKSCPVLFYF